MVAPVTVLWVIDAQQGFFDGEAAIPDADDIISRLARLLAAASS